MIRILMVIYVHITKIIKQNLILIFIWKLIITANLENKASDILYFTYWHQISWKTINELIILTSVACVFNT